MTDTAKHDRAQWRVTFSRAAYAADIDEYRTRYGKAEGERRFFAEHRPEHVEEGEGNILTTAGATAIWNALTQGTAGAFTNATAAIGVGDSSTAESAGQTDLQATTNKVRQAVDATYPTVSGATVTFKATFGTSVANFAWNEWSVFSATSGGTMLNRKVPSGGLGTKTSAASWAFTVQITLA